MNRSTNIAEPRNARGFTMLEASVVLAITAIAASVAVPIFQRVGCSAARTQSAANLAVLSTAHNMYALDFSDRQLTICPDPLGAYGGDWAAMQAAEGCVPTVLLGNEGTGEPVSIGVNCTGLPGSNTAWLTPFSFAPASLKGGFRLGNVRALNQYVNGRFLDSTFYAPDDVSVSRRAWRRIGEGADYDESVFTESTYTMSPAAMFDPRVLGDGPGSNYVSPDSFANGYRSPTVSQCQYPALKTRLMEMWCMEGAPALTNPNFSGASVPYMANHVFFGRSLAAYFDGSVRIITRRETQQAETRAHLKLWNRYTPLGSNGYFCQFSADFWESSSAHFLTSDGIRGRDVIELP